MSINVVLDIDGVLACNRANNIEQAHFFHNKGAILTAIKTHYLFPGVIELIQFLADTQNLKFSFFSAGDKERNEIFVDELLKRSLKEPKLSEIRERVRILSKQDLVAAPLHMKTEHHQLYNSWPGNKQKDLSKVLSDEDLLENTLLIDDDVSYTACHQAKNCLSLRDVSGDVFSHLNSTRKLDVYQDQGYRYLDYVIANREGGSNEKRGVKEGKLITLIKKKEGFQVCFLNNETHEYQKRMIASETNPELIDKLQIPYRCLENKKKRNSSLIKDASLIQEIVKLVESYGGMTKKIPHRANQIFYATGLLVKVMGLAQTQGISISEALFQLQYKKKKQESGYENNCRALRRKNELYLLGLEKLKEFNTQLEFTTPHFYNRFVQLRIPDEDQELLQQAMENEGGGCSIM